ncbi:zinc ribbon domain-containing protein [Micromonospora sp. MW-13]|uniref:zinc ribbon domain-containing protein n=1 Tax=Micromonospora sp. MW-13 TaxID=2094022 RepID=UPI00352FE10C
MRRGRDGGSWVPSTSTCGVGGVVGEKLALNVRSWTCPCGASQDRDVNAAMPAPRREAVTHRKLTPCGR